jgi:mono/diheme cytochrome c family protein
MLSPLPWLIRAPRPWLAAAALSVLAAPAGADAPDPVHGRDLHQRHCIDCHTDIMGGDPTAIYDRENQRIGSLNDLYEQVGRCRNSYGEAWPRSWVEDVTTWLNGHFYHFEPFDPGRDERGDDGGPAE